MVLGVGVVLVVLKDTDANDYREDEAIMQLAMRVTKTMTATTMRVLAPQLQLQALLANFQLLHKMMSSTAIAMWCCLSACPLLDIISVLFLS